MMHDQGLCKLAEECGETIQVAMKLSAYSDNRHPDGTDVKHRLTEEIADLLAAISFVVEKHKLHHETITKRAEVKLARFKEWDEEQDA